jgi:hypothetical protein
MITSNLPITSTTTDSGQAVKTFFDGFYQQASSYPADQVDAVAGFFKSRGFDEISANSTTIVLLHQSKTDNVDIFKVIDTLTGLTSIQLSSVVAEVLNYNRQNTSVLGFRQTTTGDFLEQRNIRI